MNEMGDHLVDIAQVIKKLVHRTRAAPDEEWDELAVDRWQAEA